MKRFSLIFFAAALCLALFSLQSLAQEWYLEDGDIVISVIGAERAKVTQGDQVAFETHPVITQRNPEIPTSHTISGVGQEYCYVSADLKNINIECFDTNPIHVTRAINFYIYGENTLRAHGDYSCIHPLNMGWGFTAGEEGAILQATAERGAAIGSNAGETLWVISNGGLSGGTYYLRSESGAAMGTGEGGDLHSSLSVHGDAVVYADSVSGAGIGTGKGGSFYTNGVGGSASIGNATVYATSVSGAGMGTGEGGNLTANGHGDHVDSTKLLVGPDAKLIASSESGAAIGTGKDGSFINGYIGISGDSELTSVSGAAIGTGENGKLQWDLNVFGIVLGPLGGESSYRPGIRATSESGAAVGTGKNGTFYFAGFLSYTQPLISSKKSALYSVTGAAIGTGEGGSLDGKPQNLLGLLDYYTPFAEKRNVSSEQGDMVGVGKNGAFLQKIG